MSNVTKYLESGGMWRSICELLSVGYTGRLSAEFNLLKSLQRQTSDLPAFGTGNIWWHHGLGVLQGVKTPAWIASLISACIGFLKLKGISYGREWAFGATSLVGSISNRIKGALILSLGSNLSLKTLWYFSNSLSLRREQFLGGYGILYSFSLSLTKLSVNSLDCLV